MIWQNRNKFKVVKNRTVVSEVLSFVNNPVNDRENIS